MTAAARADAADTGARARAAAGAGAGATADTAAAAQANPPALRAKPARADSVPRRSRPFLVMLRSAAVPGWGQVYNHKYVKAVAVVAGEGFLVYKAWSEFNKENDAVDRQSAILDVGGTTNDPAYIEAGLDRQAHMNRKINWVWWGIAAHLLSMMDAYVDAHLASFDADFGPPQSAGVLGEKPRLTVALRTRF